MSKNLTKTLSILLIPLVLVLMGGIILLVALPSSNGVYVEQLNIAKRYSDNKDFENAVVYYKKAIEAAPTETEAYIGLASVYFDQYQDVNSAIACLRQGYEASNSDKLSQWIDYYSQFATSDSGVKSADSAAALNSYMFETFATNTYKDYTDGYTLSNDYWDDDVYTVIYTQFDAAFSYKNSSGKNDVIDPATRKPYAYARPTSITSTNMSNFITGIDAGFNASSLGAMGASDIKAVSYDESLKKYTVTFTYKNCEIVLECDKDGNIKGNNVYNTIRPPKNDTNLERVLLSGNVIDNTTGDTVSTATLTFRKGNENKYGEYVEQVDITTGSYEVNLPVDEYTVEVASEGYLTEFFTVTVAAHSATMTKDFSITPTLVTGEIRFVLEWGSTPADLDSHLTGTASNGTSVDLSYKTMDSYKDSDIAELDVDDKNGFGPETTTLHDVMGDYEFKIHRFTESGTLGASGATVKIYRGNNEPITVSVPSDADEWWDVCTVKKGVIELS